MGNSKSAADVLAQRLKSVELAALDGNWERGQFLELVEQDHATLVDQDEKLMISRELELKQRTSGKGRGESGSGKGWQSYEHGWPKGDWYKGKSAPPAKGGGKNKKGKKNKYTWWDQPSGQAPAASTAAAAATSG